jgi:hypothetical protein
MSKELNTVNGPPGEQGEANKPGTDLDLRDKKKMNRNRTNRLKAGISGRDNIWG